MTGKKRVLRNLLIDLVCAGLALVVFALFHHVLPRQQQGLGIVISNPYAAETNDEGAALTLPEERIQEAVHRMKEAFGRFDF